MRLSHWTRATGVAFAAVALTACGGGKSDPVAGDASSDAVAKYVGSWESECYDDSGASAELRADFSKSSPDTLGGQVVVYYYIGTSCSGPVVKDDKVLSNVSLQLVGSKAVAGVQADKFNGGSDQGEAKVLLYVNGDTLQIGDVKGAKDAEGYPNEIFEYALKRI
jgi:hypothetical protein